MKRVVITGMGGITALGHDWNSIAARLRAGRNAVRRMPEWDYFDGLNSRLGCPVDDFEVPRWPRQQLRSMGRVAQLAVAASERALRDAGLRDDETIRDGGMVRTPGPDFAAALLLTANRAQRVDSVRSNSFDLGDSCASLLFRRFEQEAA